MEGFPFLATSGKRCGRLSQKQVPGYANSLKKTWARCAQESPGLLSFNKENRARVRTNSGLRSWACIGEVMGGLDQRREEALPISFIRLRGREQSAGVRKEGESPEGATGGAQVNFRPE